MDRREFVSLLAGVCAIKSFDDHSGAITIDKPNVTLYGFNNMKPGYFYINGCGKPYKSLLEAFENVRPSREECILVL